MRATPKLSLLVLLLTLIGYSFPTLAESDALLASIRKAGQVKVALASLPPYMIVSPSGEAKGSTVDLQNMVLEAMGLPKITPLLMNWDALLPGLQAHQFDYVGAGLNITEERCKVMLFSVPIYANRTGLYVLPGNPKNLTTIAQVVDRSDIKVAAISSGPVIAYMLKQGAKPEQIVRVPDVQAAIATVTGGRADAYVDGEFAVPKPEEKGLKVVTDEQTPAYGAAYAFRKEDVRFRDAFNEHLTLLIRDGMIQKLYNKYGIPNGEAQAQLLAKFRKPSDIAPNCD
ncbi:polar amino acid transport system substrate-binding protein [Bradyrhizobium elkanii]|nr:polar amino acid transport system substrate-binding protein [Bradyrhizobium elkanii]